MKNYAIEKTVIEELGESSPCFPMVQKKMAAMFVCSVFQTIWESQTFG